MTKILLFDLSQTLLFPKDNSYNGTLNALHNQHKGHSNYDFWDYFHLNNELLEYLQENRHQFSCYILTSGRIQDATPLSAVINPEFIKIYTAEDLHIAKDDPKIYRHIAQELKLHPQMITFIDDSARNIETAKEAGMSTIHYQGNDLLIPKLEELKNKEYIDKLAYLFIQDKKILVTLSKDKDTWYIPGGKREPGETDHEALIREVKEELTVDIILETIEHFHTFEAQAHGKPTGTIVRMTCYTAQYLGEIAPSGEIDNIDFFAYSEKHLTSPVDNLIFEHLHQNDIIV